MVKRSDKYFKIIWDRLEKLSQKVIPKSFKVEKIVLREGKKFMVIELVHFPYYIRKQQFIINVYFQ